MYNIFIAVGLGAVLTAGLHLSGLLTLGEAVFPGIVVMLGAYVVLARRTMKLVEKIFAEGSKGLATQPPKFDLAITTLEKGYPFAKWQIGVKTQVDAQIGVIYFYKQDFNKALPYLKRSLGFSFWLAGAMLAVIQYKKKDHDGMRKTLEVVVKRGKKQNLAWCLAAYLLCQVGDRDAAQKLLIDGVQKTNDDTKVKDALLAVQNGKKIKMKVFKEQWYQFHLERPPAQYQQVAVGGRISRAQRRGRW